MLILDAVKIRAEIKAEKSCCGGCAKGKPCCGKKKKRRRKCGAKPSCWDNLFIAQPSGLLLPDQRILPTRSRLGLLPWETEATTPSWNRPLLVTFDMSCLPCCTPHEQNCCPELEGDWPLIGTATISNACCERLNQSVPMSLFTSSVLGVSYVEDTGADVCNPIISPQSVSVFCAGGRWFLVGICDGSDHELTLISCSPVRVIGTITATAAQCCGFVGSVGTTYDFEFTA
jgi:hypothetical protein